MDLSKLPRWLLVYGFLGAIGLGGFTLKGAFADLEENKRLVQKHDLLIPQLVSDIEQIKTGNEQFRREYREDRKDSDKIMAEQTALLYKISNKV